MCVVEALQPSMISLVSSFEGVFARVICVRWMLRVHVRVRV